MTILWDMLILIGGYVLLSSGVAVVLCWIQTRRDTKAWKRVQYMAMHPSEFYNRDGSEIKL